MTVLIGILCKDGVVIASDSAATLGINPQILTIGQQPTKRKIAVLREAVIVAGTGQVGLDQRFKFLVEHAITGRQINPKIQAIPATAKDGQPAEIGNAKTSPIEICTILAQHRTLDFASTSAPQGAYGALVGLVVGNKPYLCEFATTDFQPEIKNEDLWFVAMGSGQILADPFLALMRKIFGHDGMPSLKRGIFMAAWALQFVVETNAGGVGGATNIAIISKGEDGKYRARMLTTEELEEPTQRVEAVIERLRVFTDEEPPQVPTESIPEPT